MSAGRGAEQPDAIGLRKLTSAQYTNTMHDIIRFALDGDDNAAMGVIVAAPVNEQPVNTALSDVRMTAVSLPTAMLKLEPLVPSKPPTTATMVTK